MEFARKNEDSFSNLSAIITDMHKVLCDDTDTPEEVFVQQLEEFSARIDELCYTVNSTFREAKLTERTAKRMAEINISNIRKYEALAKNALQNGRKDSALVFQSKRAECIAQADTLQQEFMTAAYSALDTQTTSRSYTRRRSSAIHFYRVERIYRERRQRYEFE